MGCSIVQAAEVKLGVDVLEEQGFAPLADKKVGLVANPTSVNSRLASTVDVLKGTDRCKLVAIFGPEHGVYGDEYAGVKVENRTDRKTGLPVFSLYGKTRKPTPEMLKGLDALVFDLQDIGSRSYTYISSMKVCLEACAEAGIEFVVLDRPNPLGGERIEGPAGVEKPFESFISALNVPYVHGMTMGELAKWVRDEVAPHYGKLTVVPMEGWERKDTWAKTGLRWVPTSPHIPAAPSCAFYAATGILGELGQVSIGVGYPLPFELVGAPWIRGPELTTALNDFWLGAASYYDAGSKAPDIKSSRPRGIHFRTARFKPFYAIFKDQPCEGVRIYLGDEAESLVEIQFRILAALNPGKLFKQATAEQIAMFDKACGSDEPRKWLTDGRDLSQLFEKWRSGCEKFREKRAKYLLYEK